MKPPARVENGAKTWLTGLALVAVVFLVTTIYSLIQTVRVVRTPDRNAVVEAPPVAALPELAWNEGQNQTAGRIKLVEQPVAPIPSKTPEGYMGYKSPEEVQRDLVKTQAEAQRELLKKYPKSPFVLTPQQITEMEAKGITLN